MVFCLVPDIKRTGATDARRPARAVAPVIRRPIMTIELLLYADRFDLFFCVTLSLEGRRANLDPGCLGRASFDDLALLGGLLLNDVIVSAGRRHKKRDGSAGES